ncbi:MAG TPA: hypothetical protein VMA72_29385 [Streptosporangiaceae bacterium]|nr:hypothetical protein [Streptosporangiaceae bacterium]
MNSNHRTESALARTRQAAASLKPVALGGSAMARRGVRSTRAWVAPQVEHTGHVVQDRIAPKISSLLYSAAQRLEPGTPRPRRWRKVAGASMVTAAAGALAGAVLSRRRQNGTALEDEADSYHETAARNGQVGTQTAAEADKDSQSVSS